LLRFSSFLRKTCFQSQKRGKKEGLETKKDFFITSDVKQSFKHLSSTFNCHLGFVGDQNVITCGQKSGAGESYLKNKNILDIF